MRPQQITPLRSVDGCIFIFRVFLVRLDLQLHQGLEGFPIHRGELFAGQLEVFTQLFGAQFIHLVNRDDLLARGAVHAA